MIDHLLQRLRFRQKGILLVSIPLFFEVVFVGSLYLSYAHLERESRLAEHGRRVLNITDAMTSAVLGLGASMFVEPGFDGVKIDQRMLVFEEALEGLVDGLVIETRGNQQEAMLVEALVSSLNQLRSQGLRIRMLLKDPLQVIAQKEIRAERIKTRNAIKTFSSALEELTSFERSLSSTRLRKSERARSLLLALLWGGVGANIFVSVWLAVVFGRQITERLAVVGRNALRMSKQAPLTETVSGNDELSELDDLMHRLADVLRETIRRERAMIDNTVDVIVALSEELNVLRVNSAAARQWGFGEESMIDAPVLDLILAGQRIRFVESMEGSRHEAQGKSFECSLVHRDGRLLESRWSVIWSEHDRTYFAIVRDITDEKEADLLQKRFLDMVTHDLRSPLSSQRTLMIMLRDGSWGDVSSEARTKLGQAVENVDYLLDLTGGLLDLRKLEVGRLELSRDLFSGSRLVEEACATLDSMLRARSISVALTAGADRDLSGDFLRLKQVLVNLLSNAVKFSPPNSTVGIEFSLSERTWKIAVTNDGPAISDENCQRLFEPFVQGAGQASSLPSGFGLGLSIARALVEAHGGQIGANPSLRGAEFWFEIPHLDAGHRGTDGALSH